MPPTRIQTPAIQIPVIKTPPEHLHPALEYLTTQLGEELAPNLFSAELNTHHLHDAVKALLAETLAACYVLLKGVDNDRVLITHTARDIGLQLTDQPQRCTLQLSELIRPLLFTGPGQTQPDFITFLWERPALDGHLIPLRPRWGESLSRSVRHLREVLKLVEDSGIDLFDAYRLLLEREATASNQIFTYRVICGSDQPPVQRRVQPGLVAQA